MDRTTATKVVRLPGLATRRLLADPRDALLSARMALWVIGVSGLARLISLPRVHALVSVPVRTRPADGADGADGAADIARAETPARLARAIDRLLALDLFVFRRSCWRRAMVLHRFLALHGIESRINFGVQRGADGSLQGHAWLEHRNQPLLEQDADAYVVTFSLPRRPSGLESCR